MANTIETDQSSSSVKSYLTYGAIGAVLLFLLDQGKVMRRIFGPLWDITGVTLDVAFKAVRETVATLDEKRREGWYRLKLITTIATFAIIMSFALGIIEYEKTGNDAWKISVIFGGVALVGLASLWVFALRFAAVIVTLGCSLALDTAGALLRTVKVDAPQVSVSTLVNKAIEKTQGLTLLPVAALLFSIWVMLFTSTGGVMVALFLALIGWGYKRLSTLAGWKQGNAYALITWMLVGAATIITARFLTLQAFPELGKSWSLRPTGEWLAGPKSGPIGWIATLIAFPMTFFIISAFASKERREAWQFVGKIATGLAVAVTVLLVIRGVLSYDKIADKEPTKAAVMQQSTGNAEAMPVTYQPAPAPTSSVSSAPAPTTQAATPPKGHRHRKRVNGQGVAPIHKVGAAGTKSDKQLADELTAVGL